MPKKKRVEAVWCYVTCPDARQAKRIATAVVEQGLAACANILGPMRSIYRWKGRIQSDREVVLILKSRRSRLKQLTARVLALHPYECPCVIALPILGGHPAYLAWLARGTAGKK